MIEFQGELVTFSRTLLYYQITNTLDYLENKLFFLKKWTLIHIPTKEEITSLEEKSLGNVVP